MAGKYSGMLQGVQAGANLHFQFAQQRFQNEQARKADDQQKFSNNLAMLREAVKNMNPDNPGFVQQAGIQMFKEPARELGLTGFDYNKLEDPEKNLTDFLKDMEKDFDLLDKGELSEDELRERVVHRSTDLSKKQRATVEDLRDQKFAIREKEAKSAQSLLSNQVNLQSKGWVEGGEPTEQSVMLSDNSVWNPPAPEKTFTEKEDIKLANKKNLHTWKQANPAKLNRNQLNKVIADLKSKKVKLQNTKGVNEALFGLFEDNPVALDAYKRGDIKEAVAEYDKQIAEYETQRKIKKKWKKGDVTTVKGVQYVFVGDDKWRKQ